MSPTHRDLCAVLGLLRKYPALEFAAANVGAHVDCQCPSGGSYPMPPVIAKQALDQLARDDHATARRARANVYKLNANDKRPALPDGFRYEATVQPATGQRYFWIVTPEWSARGGPTCLLWNDDVDVNMAELDAFWHLTNGHQNRPPMGGHEALAWIASRVGGLVPAGKQLRARVEDEAALRALAKLASDMSYNGADVARGERLRR